MPRYIPPMTELLLHGKSRHAIARDLGVTKQAVQGWFRRGYVPLARAAEVEALYGIPRAQLINPKLSSEFAPVHFDDLTDGE